MKTVAAKNGSLRGQADVAEHYSDRGSRIGEVGAANERRDMLRTVKTLEGIVAGSEPDAMPTETEAAVETDTIEEPATAAELDAVPADAMAEPTPAAPTLDRWDALPADTQQRVLEIVANDRRYQNAVLNSGPHNARIQLQSSLDEALQAVAMEQIADRSEPAYKNEKLGLYTELSGIKTRIKEDEAMRRDLLDRVEQEVRPEPEYAAADAMAAVEPDPIEEPDSVSRDTESAVGVEFDPDAVAEADYTPISEPMPELESEPVADTEPMPVETMAAVEPEPAQEPAAAPAEAPDVVEEVPVAELESRLEYCEMVPAPEMAGQVQSFVAQDLAEAKSAVENAAAVAGLPSFEQLPENVERLALDDDGNVVAVVDGKVPSTGPDLVAAEPPPADTVSPPPTAPDALPPTVTDDAPTPGVPPVVEPDPQVETTRRWDDLTRSEKQAAIDRYNEALERYREAQEVAQRIGVEGDAKDQVEIYCDYLRERIREQKPGGPPPVAVASRQPPPALDVSQVQLRNSPATRRSSRPGLEPRSRVARALMGDVQPRQATARSAGSVKDARIEAKAPQKATAAAAAVGVAAREDVAPAHLTAPPEIDYREGMDPDIALQLAEDEDLISGKNRRKGKRRNDDDERGATPEVNLVMASV